MYRNGPLLGPFFIGILVGCDGRHILVRCSKSQGHNFKSKLIVDRWIVHPEIKRQTPDHCDCDAVGAMKRSSHNGFEMYRGINVPARPATMYKVC